MITRFEVDGFKNLKDFSVDLGPYTCIAGPNSVGKSNVFDALAFLSATASGSLNQAASTVRGQGGDLEDLFAPGHDSINFGIEMIIGDSLTDEFQRSLEFNHTYLRYELQIAKDKIEVPGGDFAVTLALVSEELKPLSKTHAEENLGWVPWGSKFADSALKLSRREKPFITTEDGIVKVFQNNRSGRPAEINVVGSSVGVTALSGFGLHEYPFASAVKYELEHWLTLALEPSSMRSPSEATDPDHVNESGGNLAKTLSRITQGGADSAAFEDLVDSVRDLVDVREVALDFDKARQLFTLRARVGDSPLLPARSLSDGTLRFLTLSVLYLDPQFNGVVLFEEPENGIHPRKMEQMFQLINDLAVDTTKAVDEENPLRQVIVNTHSPAYIYQHANALDNLLLARSKPGTNYLMLSPVRTEIGWRPAARGQVPTRMVVELMEDTFPGVSFEDGEVKTRWK